MSNEMVERVAISIDKETMERFCHIPNCFECATRKDEVRTQAKAAIEAMKEPTEAMLNNCRQLDTIEGCWRRMIEAALKDG